MFFFSFSSFSISHRQKRQTQFCINFFFLSYYLIFSLYKVCCVIIDFGKELNQIIYICSRIYRHTHTHTCTDRRFTTVWQRYAFFHFFTIAHSFVRHYTYVHTHTYILVLIFRSLNSRFRSNLLIKKKKSNAHITDKKENKKKFFL